MKVTAYYIFLFAVYALINVAPAVASHKCPGNEAIKEYRQPNGFDVAGIEDFSRTHLYTLSQAQSGEAEAAAPSEEDLEEASQKLSRFLAGTKGEAAIDKIMASGDTNGDGKGSRSELNAFLITIDLGNFITRSYWVDGLLDYFAEGNPKVMTRNSMKEMLTLMELY
jgi:hypothetical protein